MLRELMSRAHGLDDLMLARALEVEALWPRDPELAELARARGLRAPRPPKPGETVLVSVNQGRASAVLWQLVPPEAQSARLGLVHFAGQAEESARVVGSRLTFDVPWLMSASQLGPLHWRARELVREPEHRADVILDGPSFGLSMALAHASLVTGAPLRSGLMATGSVHTDGTVSPVNELRTKISRIADDGLGIEELMVAAGQVAEAEGHLAELGSPIRVLGVCRVEEALRMALPTAPERIADDRQRMAAIRAFYGECAGGSSMVQDWGPMERAAAAMLSWDGLSPEQSAVLRLARDIVTRHRRNEGVLPWLDDASWNLLPDASRLESMAHVVQSHSDQGTDHIEQAIALANDLLSQTAGPRVDRAICLGAVGRAHMVVRNHAAAISTLGEALQEWRDVDQESESTRALCALLKVMAVQRPPTGVDALVRQANRVQSLLPSPSPFVAAAVGQALVLTGDAHRAVDALASGLDWWGAPVHIRAHRSRWLARAFDAVGRKSEASALREQVHQEAHPVRARFCELDAVDVPSAQADAVVERIVGQNAGDSRIAQRLIRDVVPAERARVLRDEFPY